MKTSHARKLMVWRVTAVGVALLLFVALGADEKAPESSEEEPGAKEYLLVEPREVQEFPDKFASFNIKMRDRFGEMLTRFPRALVNQNVTPQAYVGFSTDPGYGSNMLCFVSRENTDAIRVLETAVKDTKLILYGQVKGIVDMRGVFIIDRVVRGWEERDLPDNINIKMILEWEKKGGMGKKTYRIPKIGQRYEIKSPYNGRPLYLTFEY